MAAKSRPPKGGKEQPEIALDATAGIRPRRESFFTLKRNRPEGKPGKGPKAAKESSPEQTEETTGKKKKRETLFAKLEIRKARETLIENLGLLLESGLNLGLALESLARATKSKALKSKIEAINESIKVGEPLWQSMAKVELFPDHIIAFIRSGEESGRLPELLKLITSQLERARDFRAKIKSAMIYPAFVLAIAFIVLVVSFTFTIPSMAKTFSDITVELPLPTRVLIAVGNFLENWGAIFIPAMFLTLILLVYYGFIYKRTKKYGQALLVKIPVIRKLIQQIELSRMGYVMSNMLESGFSVYNSFGWLKEAASFEVYKSAYTKIQEQIGYGNSFENSFKQVKKLEKIIPDEFQQFIFAAEMSGHLPHAFGKMGQSFDSKIDVTTKNITVALEPVMLVGLGIFVFFVAVAVFLPIYNLIGAL